MVRQKEAILIRSPAELEAGLPRCCGFACRLDDRPCRSGDHGPMGVVRVLLVYSETCWYLAKVSRRGPSLHDRQVEQCVRATSCEVPTRLPCATPSAVSPSHRCIMELHAEA